MPVEVLDAVLLVVLLGLLVAFAAYFYLNFTPSKLAKSSAPERASYDERRNKIIAEIVDTERTYVNSLKLLFDVYINPLGEEPKKILPPEKHKKIFPSSLQVIRKTNEALLKKLEDRTKHGIDQTTAIGDIFVNMAPFFKCYTSYVNAFDVSREELLAATKIQKFQDFLDAAHIQNDTSIARHLPSLMIQPVQRIPRYNLLLNELLKHTDKRHPDYQQIQKALAATQAITSQLDNNKELSENLERVLELETALKLPHNMSRRLIREGVFVYKIGEKERNIACYLFNDCLVVAKKKKSRLSGKPSYKLLLQQTLHNLESIDADEDANQLWIKAPGKQITLKTASGNISEWAESIRDASQAALNSILSFNTLRNRIKH